MVKVLKDVISPEAIELFNSIELKEVQKWIETFYKFNSENVVPNMIVIPPMNENLKEIVHEVASILTSQKFKKEDRLILIKEKKQDPKKIIQSTYNEWASCFLEYDGTLTFNDGDWRSGGSVLNKDFYEHYGKNYWEAVQNYLQIVKKNYPDYYQEIFNMLEENNIKITGKE